VQSAGARVRVNAQLIDTVPALISGPRNSTMIAPTSYKWRTTSSPASHVRCKFN
jgi:hypothetical protein